MTRIFVAPALLIMLGAARPGVADPITVAFADAARVYMTNGATPSGTLNVWQTGPTIDFNLIGALSSFFPLNLPCHPCAAGTTINPGFSTVGDLARNASGWLGNPDHPDTRWSGLFIIGRLSLVTPALTLPADAPAVFRATLPLMFSGSLFGATMDSWTTTVMHVRSFSMPGTATVQFNSWMDPKRRRQFAIGSVDYVAQAVPTPEPASVLLVAIGLAAIASRRSRTIPSL